MSTLLRNIPHPWIQTIVPIGVGSRGGGGEGGHPPPPPSRNCLPTPLVLPGTIGTLLTQIPTLELPVTLAKGHEPIVSAHSFGVRLKLLGPISHSHSRPPKSHSFYCQVSHFSLFCCFYISSGLKLCKNWLYSYLICVLFIMNLTDFTNKLWQLCNIAFLSENVLY